MWRVVVILLLNCVMIRTIKLSDINKQREDLLRKERKMMLGGDMILSDSEDKANQILMDLKWKQTDYGFDNPHKFSLSKHFFEYKDKVKNTTLFQYLKDMPKGAVLHAHDTGLLSPDYVLQLTYMDDLYVCFTSVEPKFIFAEALPNTPCESQWQLMRDARYSSGNIEKFDNELRKFFTIVIDDPNKHYGDVNTVWLKFQRYFFTTGGLLTYKPVWEKYYYDTLKTFREDNVMYLEIRSVLPELYDIHGNVYDSIDTAQLYSNVTDRFCEDFPDFFGARLIYAPLRSVTSETVRNYIKTLRKLKKVLPKFIAGFDLVGQEDLGQPTKEFLPILAEAAGEFDFFFHAGETNWYGTSSDENLVDAILLGAKRLGHAYALIKHPTLIEEVKKRDIGLEVNVISNAVLKLVDDVRNHPVASFIAQNLPVIISSDDPGIWEAEPLTHDFYVTFVGIASRHSDIRLLKKLAYNSLYYSTYPDKDALIYEFQIRWIRYIDSLVRDKW